MALGGELDLTPVGGIARVEVCAGNVCRAWGVLDSGYVSAADSIGAEVERVRCRGACMLGPVVVCSTKDIKRFYYSVHGPRVQALRAWIRDNGGTESRCAGGV